MQPDPTPASSEPEQPAQTPSHSQPTTDDSVKTPPGVKTLTPDKEPVSGTNRPEVRPHAFVIMPFGKKKGADGSVYDFNAIYSQLIQPALEIAGFEPFRADEE